MHVLVREIMVPQEPKAHLETKGQWDHQGHKGLEDRVALLEDKAHQGHRVHLEIR